MRVQAIHSAFEHVESAITKSEQVLEMFGMVDVNHSCIRVTTWPMVDKGKVLLLATVLGTLMWLSQA
jgi:hypothetical protein